MQYDGEKGNCTSNDVLISEDMLYFEGKKCRMDKDFYYILIAALTDSIPEYLFSPMNKYWQEKVKEASV